MWNKGTRAKHCNYVFVHQQNLSNDNMESIRLPARMVPTSVQSQKMNVINILDMHTRPNVPQSSRHSQLHPITHYKLIRRPQKWSIKYYKKTKCKQKLIVSLVILFIWYWNMETDAVLMFRFNCFYHLHCFAEYFDRLAMNHSARRLENKQHCIRSIINSDLHWWTNNYKD